jgi:hypothetical protein
VNVIALILFIIAAVLFVFGGAYRPATREGGYAWYSHTNLALAILTVGFIVQFCATSHSVTF